MSTPRRTIPSQGEFIVLIAMMFACIAFSIDAILPALPDIGGSLSPKDPNRAQLIIAAFILGMGIGTFFTGPLSDAFGRKPVLLWGLALYGIAAIAGYFAQSLDVILITRVLMGLGVAAPRVVAVAIVRDLYAGRDMARIISLAMTIFTIVPAFAPLLGTGIIWISDWRGIFIAFAIFGAIIAVWTALRIEEPLAVEDRRPLSLPLIWGAVREMAKYPAFRLPLLCLALCQGMLFTMIVLVQPVYDVVFDKAESFPLWFMGVALISGTASYVNARIVVRLGMRKVVIWSLGLQTIASALMLLSTQLDLGTAAFPLFLLWQVSVFFMVGVTMGNLNSIALEPLGHIAGIGASIMGAVSTVLSAVIAAGTGQMFDGTLVPLVAGVLVNVTLGFLCMLWLARSEARTAVTA
ncbi:MAG: multidrug effflux MFS transporter [Epibacterium sp.]|nr:multidrug effflux MFS transporter [Epibacterium sp.]NQX72291.1 multidrug effflux MFS transporter [Epibacterium sp.]